MRILGVDPGLRVTGYGVIEVDPGSPGLPRPELLEAGIVRTGAGDGISARLAKIHGALSEAVKELKPERIAIEKLYAHYEHPSTAILMGHARGVVCLLAGQFRIPLVNIASTHVKKAVTGHGHAGKSQVQRMVQNILSLKNAPTPADVTDALAVAIACASLKSKFLMTEDRKQRTEDRGLKTERTRGAFPSSVIGLPSSYYLRKSS